MRNLLINYSRVIILLVVILEILVAIGLIKTFFKNKNINALLSFIVTIGLIYDASIMFIGDMLDPTLLKSLSQFRFIFHGVLVPLLIPIGFNAINFNGKKMLIVYIVTALIILAGFYMGTSVQLELSNFANITRYVSSSNTPRLAKIIERAISFGTVIPLMICGLIAIFKKNGPFYLLGGVLMFLFSALGPATGNTDLIFLISLFGELLMVLCFYLATRKNKLNKDVKEG